MGSLQTSRDSALALVRTARCERCGARTMEEHLGVLKCSTCQHFQTHPMMEQVAAEAPPDSGPGRFRAVRGDETNIDACIARGDVSFAVNIDWRSRTIYFGDSHSAMLSRFPISREEYRKGIVGIDDVHNVKVLHLWDMRATLAQVVDAPKEREGIVRAIRRDILGKPD